MRNSSALTALIPRTRARILAPMVMDPAKAWFLTELATHLKVRHTTLQRELTALARSGILLSWRNGGRRYYRIDKTTPVFPDLSRLLIKTVALVDLLRSALAEIAGIDVAFVYGSLATENDRANSDVDLFIVGTVGMFALSGILKTIESRILRPINPVIYTKPEFNKRVLERDHFVSSVLAKPKLFVLGKMDDVMAKAPGTRPSRRGSDKPAGNRRAASNGKP